MVQKDKSVVIHVETLLCAMLASTACRRVRSLGLAFKPWLASSELPTITLKPGVNHARIETHKVTGKVFARLNIAHRYSSTGTSPLDAGPLCKSHNHTSWQHAPPFGYQHIL
jgi:hypothetical protein